MKKIKRLFIAAIVFMAVIVPVKALALEFTEVKDEKEFVAAVDEGKNVKIAADFEITENVVIDKKMTIDLNGHTITFAYQKYIKLVGGNLEITGKGTMLEVEPYFAPVIIKGSENKDDTDYSTLTVGKDVTLKGWSGIFIDQIGGTNKIKDSYGVTVNVYGTAVGLVDSDGSNGSGIYVNGNIKHKENCPIVNIYKGANISAKGFGIYAAGYSKYNITGATIEGVEGGIGIKSGVFNIKDTKVIGTGNKADGSFNNNGINSTGSAIQIESNNGYAGGINITIDGGSFESKESYAIYHYLAKKNETEVVNNSLESLVINGGTFTGDVKLVDNDKVTVTKGTFTSSSIKDFVKDPYKVVKGDGVYEVVDKDGGVVVAPVKVVVSDTINKEIAKEITDANLDNTNSGLLEAVDTSKLQGVSDDLLVEYEINSELKSYDEKNKVLTFDIKPYYTVGGVTVGVIPNSAINGTIKIKLPIPSSIKDTHVKVVHKSGDLLIDEKKYEIKTEDGQKYVLIETNSFSTFELNFYTPQATNVNNPDTQDNILSFALIATLSVGVLGTVLYISKRKKEA